MYHDVITDSISALVCTAFIRVQTLLHLIVSCFHAHYYPTMSDNPSALRVLVSGAGIAGPCFAFWLHKLLPSSQITILERAREPRIGGQAVDIRSAAVPIVERMGILQQIKEKTTTEVGIDFIYADGKTRATFPATGNDEEQSSKAKKTMDRCEVLMDASDV